jgi:LAO/AO transport system kinase
LDPRAATCSALHKKGITEIWDLVETFRGETQKSGVFKERRQAPTVDWFNTRLQQAVMHDFRQRKAQTLAQTQAAVAQGELPVAVALERILGKTLG